MYIDLVFGNQLTDSVWFWIEFVWAVRSQFALFKNNGYPCVFIQIHNRLIHYTTEHNSNVISLAFTELIQTTNWIMLQMHKDVTYKKCTVHPSNMLQIIYLSITFKQFLLSSHYLLSYFSSFTEITNHPLLRSFLQI